MKERVDVSFGTITVSSLPMDKLAGLRALSAEKPEAKVRLDWVQKMIPFIHAAIAPNHPEMTLEQLAAQMTLWDVDPLLDAVVHVSGLRWEGESKLPPVPERVM